MELFEASNKVNMASRCVFAADGRCYRYLAIYFAYSQSFFLSLSLSVYNICTLHNIIHNAVASEYMAHSDTCIQLTQFPRWEGR